MAVCLEGRNSPREDRTVGVDHTCTLGVVHFYRVQPVSEDLYHWDIDFGDGLFYYLVSPSDPDPGETETSYVAPKQRHRRSRGRAGVGKGSWCEVQQQLKR